MRVRVDVEEGGRYTEVQGDGMVGGKRKEG